MSNATSTASTPAAVTSATTSSSALPTQAFPQYWPSASAYGPWDAIHTSVPG